MNLPNNILVLIASKLPFSDLYNFCQISDYNAKICTNTSLWQLLINRNLEWKWIIQTVPDNLTLFEWFKILVANYLLDDDIDIFDLFSFGYNEGYLSLVKYAVQTQNFSQKDITIAIKSAALYGYSDIVKYFIQNNLADKNAIKVAITAAKFGKHFDIVEYLRTFLPADIASYF